MLFTDAIKLLPGFRFRPTDEELVCYYLKRKVLGRILPLEVIAEIDLYKYEPWDLPEKSALPSRDLEWYFFIPRDKKYPNGSRANRATAKGYWKSTGKDRSVSSSSRGVGTKKTLVYYNGRAPRGERTNWVMHEYRLNDIECQRIHAEENGFVLCRIYQKSGLGPKNGEQYGAPVEDDDFEDSPMAEVDGGGPLKPKVPWRRPISPNTFLEGSCGTECDDDYVSFGINMDGQQQSCLVFEPRDLNMHFEKQYGEVQQKGVGNFTCCTCDDVVSAANGKIAELTVAAPVTLEDEAEILEQLLGECTDQLKSTNSHQINPMAAEDGCHQVGAQLPRDGDFLELNDLSSLSDSKDCNNFVKENEKNATIRLKDYADEAQDSLMQAFPTFDSMAGWEMFLSEEVQCEREQVMPKVVEMQSTLSTVSHDSQHQPLTKDTFESFSAPPVDHTVDTRPAGPTQHIESVDENSLKMLNRLNAYVSEKDIFRGLLESEGNSELLMQEGFYFDAVPLFPDVDVCEEFSNTNLESLNDYAMPQVTLENKGDEPLADRISNVKDDDGSSQGQAVYLEGGRRSPRSLSLFLRFMDSLPTLPASAAELTPKATSPRSAIHVTATGIAVNSVSVTCTCIGTCVPSSCVNCSLTKAEKKGRFVRSVSFVGQREVSLRRWDTGISISAVFWGILAIFIWVFVAARAWKVWGTSMQAECTG